MTSLRSQLDKARAEKESVEEQLTETQMMLTQQQVEHKTLVHNRAREMEQWTDEREKSLSLVEEMSKEVSKKSSSLQHYCKLLPTANVLLWFYGWE